MYQLMNVLFPKHTQNFNRPKGHLWPTWLYEVFPNYLINGTTLEKKKLNTKCVSSLQILKILILRRTQRDTIKAYVGLHVKHTLLLPDFNETWIFPDRFSKNTQISNLMKIHRVGAELFHTDGQRDRQT